MIAYKFLGTGGLALFSGRHWLPDTWVEAAGPLEPCRNGVHACEPHDLPYWLSDELWQVELDGEQIRGPQSIVARRGRLVRKIEAWNPGNARSFAQQCRARAEAIVATLPAEQHEQAGQFLETASTTYDAGNYAVCAYASAMAFTLLAPSAVAAFSAERAEQGALLQRLLAI
jgi:hypothetical protein